MAETRLKVIGSDPSGTVKHPKVFCECVCGKVVSVFKTNLSSGQTLSCGCWHKEVTAKRSTTHGRSASPTYGSWSAMIERCTRSSNVGYKDYGGRGIKVCSQWMNSFENFLEDMGERPIGKTLDRKDVDGDYTKENCRWASYREQTINQRGFKGVSWDATNSRWRACISPEKGFQLRLGSFIDWFDAVCARKSAENKYYRMEKQNV